MYPGFEFLRGAANLLDDVFRGSPFGLEYLGAELLTFGQFLHVHRIQLTGRQRAFPPYLEVTVKTDRMIVVTQHNVFSTSPYRV